MTLEEVAEVLQGVGRPVSVEVRGDVLAVRMRTAAGCPGYLDDSLAQVARERLQDRGWARVEVEIHHET